MTKSPLKVIRRTISIFTLLGLAVAIWAFAIEPGLLTQRDFTVPKWERAPLRIAFFSDLHAGAPYITDSYIEDLIARINKMEPDLVLIGGDLVITGVIGGKHMSIEKIADHLKALKPRLGIYVTLGNHDWWENGEHISKVLKENGINVLENESRLLEIAPDSKFWLVGIGDDFTNHADVEKALSGINTDDPQVLFMHDPASLFQIRSKYFLALGGHLHGGQIYIPGYGAIVTAGDAPKEWAKGWVDFEFGSLFVSKGVGTSIIPVRLNALPEFVILDLKQ